MANVILNSDAEVRLYEARVIAQVEKYSVLYPLIGMEDDDNSLIFKPSEMYKKGNLWTVHLRKAVLDPALEDGADYEDQGKQSIISTVNIVQNERGMVFGGQKTFEEMKTILNLREIHYMEAKNWHINDFDVAGFAKMKLATGSLPTRAARAASQYNVEFTNEGNSWGALTDANMITAKSISRAKKYFQVKRGIRAARITKNSGFGYMLILPPEATFVLGQEDVDFKGALEKVLPRKEDHILFKGHGLNPWGAWDGVVIVEDSRPVYGGATGTFLNTEEESSAGYIRFQGIFMGAQGLAFARWTDMSWFERINQHGRKFEVSVNHTVGWVKTVINLNTLASPSNRDYGIGYFCSTAPVLD